MPNKPLLFRFVGKLEDDVVIGDRVQMRLPVAAPPLSPQLRISLEAFQQFFRDLRQNLLSKYGQDLADFELEFEPTGAIWVIFTRPMDVVEQTQINVHRQAQEAGQTYYLAEEQQRPAFHPRGRLPDPAAA